MTERMDYKKAGVDIKAGEEAVKRIKKAVRSTFSSHVLTDLGQFGGFYAPDLSAYRQPVLVSSIDGVGTKLKVAILQGRHDTIGEDLVNHCINDILVGGAKPLFFLDYIGTGKLDPGVVEEIISGMVRGCRNTGCALIGGEMAEMPGFYQSGEYDVAGAIVGIVEKDRVIDGRRIKKKDVLVGLHSSGLHTNGYSLARSVFFERAGLRVDSYVEELGATVGETLLRIHRCYLSVVSPIMDAIEIKGMSHITGGGLIGNTRRILPDGLDLKVDWQSWEILPVFRLIQEIGDIPDEEMHQTFNMGIGYVLIVDASATDRLIQQLRKYGERPAVIGEVIAL